MNWKSNCATFFDVQWYILNKIMKKKNHEILHFNYKSVCEDF